MHSESHTQYIHYICVCIYIYMCIYVYIYYEGFFLTSPCCVEGLCVGGAGE